MRKKTERNFFTKIIFAIILFFVRLKPSETGKISGIYILKNKISNIFFIQTNDGYIAVDAGITKKNMLSELNRLKIDALEVKHVLLTHTDHDHVAGLSLFTNAKIYINEDELQFIDGTKNRQLFVKNSLPENVKVDNIALLKDEKINLSGCKIQCIKTPGHTLGSMSYLINDTYLFTGDALKIKKNSLRQHPFGMNNKKSKESIQIIKSLIKESTYVFTAHYGYHEAKDLNV